MKVFLDVNEVLFRGTYVILLFISILAVVCLSMSIFYKLKYKYIVSSVLIIIFSLFAFISLKGAIEIRDLNREYNGYLKIFYWPSIYIFLIITILILSSIFLIIFIIRTRLYSLTSMAVYEALAVLPSGLCFFDETGRILLMNQQINEECRFITNKFLSNGNEFFNALKIYNIDNNSIIIIINNNVKNYKLYEHNLNNKKIYELISTDITKEYGLKEILETKSKQLEQMNLRLKNYGDNVTDLTKEKEILNSRVRIHNKMGSLILTTKRKLSLNQEYLDDIIKDWKDIISLLYTTNISIDRRDYLLEMAKNIGVAIKINDNIETKSEKLEEIINFAIFECAVNTARHADGSELYVNLLLKEGQYIIKITNDGNQPKQEIKEGGGLSSLRSLVENNGGIMKIKSVPYFELEIIFLKENQYVKSN
ncbi:MAG: hypothetical protein ACI35S_06255 [Anaeroplasma sp.]